MRGKQFTSAVAFMSLMISVAFAADTSTVQTDNKANQSMQMNSTKSAGEAFLEANKSKAGVVTLPSGLQYKVIKSGNGPNAKATDTVQVNYEGSLVNGKVFDSSYQRGEPATFPVNAVIPGWVEALQLMNEGSTWELVIPANLAYGANGVPPVIGPNETLIFKVELLKIKP